MQIRKKQFLNQILIFNLIGGLSLPGFDLHNVQKIHSAEISVEDTSYLEKGDPLEDYILDTGDILRIEFINLQNEPLISRDSP